MKTFALLGFAFLLLGACGLQESRRGVGNEGFLIIQSDPADALVYVDGQKAGEAAQFEKDPLELPSGTHKIEIRKAGYQPESRDVYVSNQSRHTLKISLRKAP